LPSAFAQFCAHHLVSYAGGLLFPLSCMAGYGLKVSDLHRIHISLTAVDMHITPLHQYCNLTLWLLLSSPVCCLIVHSLLLSLSVHSFLLFPRLHASVFAVSVFMQLLLQGWVDLFSHSLVGW
jgi:hypothetical protein